MKRPGLLLALVCHVALSLGYLMLTPVFEGPDENEHYRYAFHLANAGELPVPRGTARAQGRSPLDEVATGHHPPLYYRFLALSMTIAGWDDVVPAPLVNPKVGSPGQYLTFRHGSDEAAPVSAGVAVLRWLRGWSVVLGLMSILFVHRLGMITSPGRPIVADVAALLVACLPMWSFLHGVLNSDILSVLWCQVALVLFAGFLSQARLTVTDGIVTGAILSMAVLTKLTGMFLLVVFALVVLHFLRTRPSVRGATVRFAALAVAVVLVVAGPHFWRNYTTFDDPLLLNAHRAAYVDTLVPEGMTMQWLLDGFCPQILTSLLGQLGWFVLPPHRWLVWGGTALGLIAMLGLVRAWRRGEGPRHFVLLGGSILLVFGLTVHFNMEFRQPQGRLLFPVIGPMAVLFATGLVAVIPTGKSWQALFVVPPTVGLMVLAWHFRPAFDPALAPAPSDHVSLVTGVTTSAAKPRIRLKITQGATPTLTWQEPGTPLTNYTVYIFDRQGRVWGATYEWTEPPKLSLTGPTFEFPAEWWELFPKGREYGFKVRRLPDRAAGIWPPNLPESNVVWLRKE